MQAAQYMIGVDIGTTSTKVVLFDTAGRIKAQQSVGYPLLMPVPGAAEQEPEVIFRAVTFGIREAVAQARLAPGQLLCISFSAAMHSLIAVDAAGQPLTNSITWADNRAARWADTVLAQGGLAVYRRTGTPIHPMSPFIKLVWLKNEHQDLFRQAARFISIKEYVFYRLFGRYLVDYSIASATGLLNLETLAWDAEALQMADITADRLSELVPTTYVLPRLPDDVALGLGIPATTPIITGASDGVLSNLGLDAIRPGVVALTIGTSGAIRTVVERPVTDPHGRLFCYALTPQHWVVGGAVNNGGIILAWARDQLAGPESAAATAQGKEPFDVLTEMAASVPAGAGGLLFHPYLAGERAPLWNAHARGSFYGLNLNHTKAHLLRAIAEGVVLNLEQVLRLLENFAGPARRIHASGGFARSGFLRQLLADIFARPVVIPESVESSCLGAAVLGLYALGRVPSLDIISSMVGTTGELQPQPHSVSVYQQVIPVYAQVLEALQREYATIARLQAQLTPVA